MNVYELYAKSQAEKDPVLFERITCHTCPVKPYCPKAEKVACTCWRCTKFFECKSALKNNRGEKTCNDHVAVHSEHRLEAQARVEENLRCENCILETGCPKKGKWCADWRPYPGKNGY